MHGEMPEKNQNFKRHYPVEMKKKVLYYLTL